MRSSPGLVTLIGLEALGPGQDGIRSQAVITIPKFPAPYRQDRQAFLRRALVYMARHFGHAWARKELR